MCISASPAHFSRTKVYAGEVTKGRERPIHVNGYQNVFRNAHGNFSDHPDSGWSKPPQTGNAILLVVPAKPGSMTPENFLDTSKYPHILEDMEESIQERERSVKSLAYCDSSPNVVVFDRGSWRIALAKHGRYIPEILPQIPEAVRPNTRSEVYEGISEVYPDHYVVLGCFNNQDAKQGEPLFYWYEPLREDVLFIPALDSHDGKMPRMDEMVRVDHTVLFGTDCFDNYCGHPVAYRDYLDEGIEPYLPKRVAGDQFPLMHMPNGDFVSSVESVRKGRPEIRREAPSNR